MKNNIFNIIVTCIGIIGIFSILCFAGYKIYNTIANVSDEDNIALNSIDIEKINEQKMTMISSLSPQFTNSSIIYFVYNENDYKVYTYIISSYLHNYSEYPGEYNKYRPSFQIEPYTINGKQAYYNPITQTLSD